MICDYKGCKKNNCTKHYSKPIKPKKPKEVNWYDHAGLGVSVKNRNDYADYDYIEKLDKKTLHWLKGFHREYINADFSHKHKKLFKSQTQKRECYTLNNIRNRCLYNITKVKHDLYLNPSICEVRNEYQYPECQDYEEKLIEQLENE